MDWRTRWKAFWRPATIQPDTPITQPDNSSEVIPLVPEPMDSDRRISKGLIEGVVDSTVVSETDGGIIRIGISCCTREK